MSTINGNATIGGIFRLNQIGADQRRSFERLSTGERINRGADDPAGLIASERLGARQAELGGAIRAIERNSLRANARDGALGAIGSMARDLGGMVVSAANTGAMSAAEVSTAARGVGQIVSAMDQTVATAGFGGSRLLDGFDSSNLGRTEIGTDPDTGDAIYASASDLERLVVEDPEAAQLVARQVVEDVAVARASEGARARGQEAVRRASETEAINTAAARSSIRDADYARETADRVVGSIRQRATIMALKISRESEGRLIDLLA